ncbi:MAG: type II secretion system protein GspE [Candidatus Omnitrophica bacterium CG08_land_8_20_14_0_20_41_16]|uniref:Type II secretion system protein GspE n=1 Tax=Candidatus Sherwoodlollariibacterium unditelluris TaxID=1974757 RepID=A0A2G9YK23_9BACT|nr:MAG: type II secretion system protein GspE [Candidatus Omnitrophica bacterium CG23_combo_of_CG06-09_8_20_14_all_41_10]PIS33525.1 MAG: type II secretion system protein GspE [Candidatus Omnitrophica bacterium CG08_land_8_20_14_0_20_41_16]
MISLKDRLTEILINNKLITQEQLKQALLAQKEKGGRLSDIIVGLKFIKESELVSVLSEGLGLPLMDLKRFKIDPGIVKIIPVNIARHYQIIPLSKMGDTITLAMADPLNIFAIDYVSSLTGYKINPIISSNQDIAQAIDLVYPDPTKGVIDDLLKEMSASSIELIREEREVLPSAQELGVISRQAPVIQLTNMILGEAVRKKASDILIEPFSKRLRVRFRIDGILYEEKSPPKSIHASIVSRIKVMSDLNIAEHRLPQDGRFKIKLLGKEVDFRVSILPSSFGEKVAVRILDKSQATLNLGKLGFSRNIIANLEKMARLPHGMMLVCGPTGSGKTTTLYSILKLVDSPDKNIVTVEDPVEFQLEGINQVTARPEIGLTFAASLRSILRQDPNIIMIGEIRDYETVDIAIKSALTGHLVLSTLHTTTAPGAVVRLVNMGVEPYLINSSLVCVVGQRLVRKICPHCKEEYIVKKEILDTLGLNIDTSKEARFFRGKGCINCFNMGYMGRTGIAEVLLFTPGIRDLILSRAQEHVIKQKARQEGMKTLREDGLAQVLKGVTTLEEILRVTAPDE